MPIYATIIQVESEFDNIYRITAENGLILDIPEKKQPPIGSVIEYIIDINDIIDTKHVSGYTIMNGIIFKTNTSEIIVSFGGLLANIPLDETLKRIIKNQTIKNQTIKNQLSLTYKIIE